MTINTREPQCSPGRQLCFPHAHQLRAVSSSLKRQSSPHYFNPGGIFTESSACGIPEWGFPSVKDEGAYSLRTWQVQQGSLCPLRTDQKCDGGEGTSSLLSCSDHPPPPQSPCLAPGGSPHFSQGICELLSRTLCKASPQGPGDLPTEKSPGWSYA